MTAKEFLSRAYLLDQQINCKLEQISTLRELACRCTSNITDERVNSTKDNSKMENIILKIVDLEREINIDIDRLVDLKKEISIAIATVKNPVHRLILELRYITGKDWQAIADELHYDICHVQRVHGQCLKNFNFHNRCHKIS